MQAVELYFKDINIDDTAEFLVTITDELIRQFSELSGDINPLHTSKEYAQTTSFREPVVHGMIAGMFFSRLVGMYLPGKFALYISQNLVFHKPIFALAAVVVRGTVIEKTDAFQIIRLKTEVWEKEQVMVSGEALIKVLQ
jgi:acyl dehydratase